jgi:hypothetical protein
MGRNSPGFIGREWIETLSGLRGYPFGMILPALGCRKTLSAAAPQAVVGQGVADRAGGVKVAGALYAAEDGNPLGMSLLSPPRQFPHDQVDNMAYWHDIVRVVQ